jgi:5-methylcytosine-specific restriction endonuclease McrA
VHHRTYARIGSEDPMDLVVLCSRCHRKHHDTLRATVQRQLKLPF